MSRATYCKCKNTYCISCCKGCNAPDYWKQGIGNITGISEDSLMQENGGLILQEDKYNIIL
tara:strand:+ start:8542 stop:8724 length:183 start_codon:yes stop_codon:yes gene_type:complete